MTIEPVSTGASHGLIADEWVDDFSQPAADDGKNIPSGGTIQPASAVTNERQPDRDGKGTQTGGLAPKRSVAADTYVETRVGTGPPADIGINQTFATGDGKKRRVAAKTDRTEASAIRSEHDVRGESASKSSLQLSDGGGKSGNASNSSKSKAFPAKAPVFRFLSVIPAVIIYGTRSDFF